MPETVVIVGGVAGGASAAARARRISEDANIVLFERGEDISFANCGLPYHIGGIIKERSNLLVASAEALRTRFRIDVRTRTEVLRIDRSAREVKVQALETGETWSQPFTKLILSTGAEPIRPPLPGIDLPGIFTLRNLPDMDRIMGRLDGLDQGHAVVVGGGFIGLEMAENLMRCGLEVTLFEMTRQVMPPLDPEMAATLHRHLQLHGIKLRLGSAVGAFEQKNGRILVRPEQGEALAADLVILAIGVRPEARLAREAGLAVGERGGIVVDDHMRTSDPDIFAVGDAVEVVDLVLREPTLIPLAGPANRQGRIAADNALGRDVAYRDSQGTNICKVFDLAAGSTGASERSLERAGRHYEKVYLSPDSHAGYYPGATPISFKLLFDPEDGRVLGAQAVGADGVDKRLDVLAVAIRAGMTVFDLEHLELTYAPPYGSAKDPVNMAGFIAANVLRGDVGLVHADEIAHCDPASQQILDVRTGKEHEKGAIPGALHIPLDDLRNRLAELPRDRELLVYCAAGLRSYFACRILTQKGFRCRHLPGGYPIYRDVHGIT